MQIFLETCMSHCGINDCIFARLRWMPRRKSQLDKRDEKFWDIEISDFFVRDGLTDNGYLNNKIHNCVHVRRKGIAG